MPKYYIIYDCGTQSTRTCIYDDNFALIASESVPTTIYYPKPDWAEMDAEHYVQSVRDCIRKCMEKSKINPKDVRAICGDGIICGIVGVDENCKAVTQYIPYLDVRAAEDAHWVENNVEPLWALESGNAHVDSYLPPMLARWFLKNSREFREKGRKFMNNGSYVAARLANLKAEDAFIDHATLSGWLIGYHAEKKEWSEAQMKLLGIPMNLLPKIVKPWDIIGHLSEEEAAKTGLCAGIPIAAGAGDTMQSILGCGLVESGMAGDIGGTASMFTIMVNGIDEELTKSKKLNFSIGTLPDTYFYWGFIRTGGLSLRWFRDNICNKKDDSKYYDELNKMGENIPAGSNGTIFFPYLQGGDRFKNASGCFLNMTMSSDYAELWRAVLESIAYEYLALVDALKAGGIEVNEVTITEGCSKSDLWNQIKADVLGVQTKTLKRSEGAIISNVAVAAYAVGDIPSIKGAIIDNVAIKNTFTPKPANIKLYRNIFEIQQKLLRDKMVDVFDSLSKIREM